MKLKLELDEVFAKIKNQEHFECELADSSVYIKIQEYVPYICCAIHNGHNLRCDLQKLCLLSEKDRWYEEDPATKDFISSLPIIIAGNDSRYEYDLNREPSDAIYSEVWGKKVWKTNLSQEQKDESLNKHNIFYQIIDAVILSIKKSFDTVLVFDIHSYNYKRHKYDTPVFNVGTENIDKKKYSKDIKFWLKELSKISLPNIENRIAENEIFYGRGYLLSYITKKHENTLVFATEIKKIYCDEESGEIYPVIIDELSKQLKHAIVNTTKNFVSHHTKVRIRKKNKLLSSELNNDIFKIDKKLYHLAKNFEILSFINPINIEQARKDFFKSKFSVNPSFVYKQLSIDAFDFKRKLYSLPVEEINDISLKMLYQNVIDSYADKVDIIASIGTDKFLYNSLRYFGEPSIADIKNAEYLLHFLPISEQDNIESFDYKDVYKYFAKISNDYNFKCKILVTNKIISKVQVLNSKKSVLIRKDSRFSEKALKALAAHEIGVHMLTTMNSFYQPLNIFKIGTPKNTHTQEGLAILSEYLSGNLTINRLHFLALRVMVISKMIEGYDFKKAFEYLMDQKMLSENQAFYLISRVYRGGGFTKDFLYLKGFKDIFKLYSENINLNNLLIGKTSVQYLPLINEMIERKIFLPPPQLTKEFVVPDNNEPIIDYILQGLK